MIVGIMLDLKPSDGKRFFTVCVVIMFMRRGVGKARSRVPAALTKTVDCVFDRTIIEGSFIPT
jgi:hypothetical protein